MKFTYILASLCLLALGVMPCTAQRTNNGGLHPARLPQNGRYGYIDSSGEFRIPPQFVQAHPFSDGFACVELDGERRGVIDTTGAFTDVSQCDFTTRFHEGLARFDSYVNGERKFGYVDHTGRVVITPQFTAAGDFAEGLAWAGDEVHRIIHRPGSRAGSESVVEGVYGFIDRTGRYVIPKQFHHLPGDFAEGLALVYVPDPAGASFDKYLIGFIDRTGAWRIPARFHSPIFGTHFSEGLAAVIEAGTYVGIQNLLFIDTSGNVRIRPPRINSPAKRIEPPNIWAAGLLPSASALSLARYSFAEHLAPFPTELGIAFVDRTGRIVIRPQFCDTHGFSEGLAAVQVLDKDGRCGRDNGWGYIDHAGRFVIAPQFGEARMFAGGLAVARSLDRTTCHYIDQRGRIIRELSTQWCLP
jgi:WG containing repeat